MPYTLGTDMLPPQREGLKGHLLAEEEERLTDDMLELYDRLLPSAESDDRRRQFVRKLEKLFNDKWPGKEIKAHVFGSSGNKLCSSDSDGMLLRLLYLGLSDCPSLTVTSSGYLHNNQLQRARACVFAC